MVGVERTAPPASPQFEYRIGLMTDPTRSAGSSNAGRRYPILFVKSRDELVMSSGCCLSWGILVAPAIISSCVHDIDQLGDGRVGEMGGLGRSSGESGGVMPALRWMPMQVPLHTLCTHLMPSWFSDHAGKVRMTPMKN